MKRARIENVVLEPILPEELWPGVLRYLTLRQRYQFLIVCKAWSVPRGLIDQSVHTMTRHDQLLLPLSRLINLTTLETRWWQEVYNTISNGLLKNLTSLYLFQCVTIYKEDNFDILTLLKQLSSLTLHGSIATYVCLLPALTTLTTLRILSPFPLTIAYNPFASLTQLTDLTLRHTHVIDTMLETLTNLRHLHLYDNTSISSAYVGGLTQLRSLSIEGSASCTQGVLRGLTNLTVLNLDENDVLRDNDITHLTSLRSLSLDRNPSITYNALASFLHLTKLVFGNEKDTEILCQLTQLRELRFEGNQLCPITDVNLAFLTRLTHLHITSNIFITTNSLSLLTNLVTLELSATTLYDIDLSLLPISLRNLDLSYSTDWQRSIEKMATSLTNLRVLTLGLNSDDQTNVRTDWLSTLSVERLCYTMFTVSYEKVAVCLDKLPRHVEAIEY